MGDSALSDLCVIDCSRVLAGPYCTMLLADYGAEVIKIEQPKVGDGTRQWGPPWIEDQSAYYLSVNRNKRSVTLNLKSHEGREILHGLTDRADIFIENFKPGTMKKLALDYETVSDRNPGLIYCSISGYGQTGPYRDRPGYDFAIQAEGGIMSITGPANGPPHKVGVAIVDISAGLFAVNGILAAVHHRMKTGVGQYIDVALLDAQLGWLANVAQNYLISGEEPGRYGNAHPNIVPYEVFATVDGNLALAIGTDAQFRRFCTAAGRSDLAADLSFRTNSDRVAARDVLVPELQRVIEKRKTDDWLELLRRENIPSAPVNNISSALNDPQTVERNMVQEVEHPTVGKLKLIGPVAKLSETPAEIRTAPPPLGFDTDEVLRQYLDLDPEQIARLRREGII
jgi:formyl-CoA transferase